MLISLNANAAYKCYFGKSHIQCADYSNKYVEDNDLCEAPGMDAAREIYETNQDGSLKCPLIVDASKKAAHDAKMAQKETDKERAKQLKAKKKNMKLNELIELLELKGII